MIDDEKRAQILRLFRVEKWRVGTIAREVGVHHSTIKGALVLQGEDPTSVSRSRMVDPYVPFIKQTLDTYPDLQASRLYEMVKERGYLGQPDHFRSIVALYRPRLPAQAYLRLTTLPGEQAQVDWGHFGQVRIGQARRTLSAFVMVLSYSRQLYLEFFYGQTQGVFLLGHQHAFESDGVGGDQALVANAFQVLPLDGSRCGEVVQRLTVRLGRLLPILLNRSPTLTQALFIGVAVL